MAWVADDRVLPMVALSLNAIVPGRGVERPIVEDIVCDVRADSGWKTGDAERLETVSRGSACSLGDRLRFEL